MTQIQLRCSVCAATYRDDAGTFVCAQDGGNLDVVLDYESIRAAHSPKSISSDPDGSIWRYQPLLPVGTPPESTGTLRTVGDTPYFRSQRLESKGTGASVWIKDDTRLPTASLKDRASAVVVAHALENGIERIITASTGNAGVALAGMAAAAGLEAVVVAPENAPTAKVAQILVYGARLVLVRGGYSDAFDLTVRAAQQLGWYCRNTGYNPMTAEGKKTVAFEICEKFTRASGEMANDLWVVPDRVVVPVGDGNIITGVHKGFKDLKALGWIEKIPKLTGVQAKGSAAIANAWESNSAQITPVVAKTVADSISAARPSDGVRALRAAKETDGGFVTVTDEAILAAMSILARDAGVYAEPAACATYAGLRELSERGDITPDEHVVLLVTGHGLKDTDAALHIMESAPAIEPSLDALWDALN